MPEGFTRKVENPRAPWWLENPGRFDELEDPEAARDNLVRISFGYWDWIRNVWEGRKEAKALELKPPSIRIARREGMRVVGDYILTACDCRDGRVFPDAVAGGGWSLDTHDPLGMENSGGDGWWHPHHHVPPYTIPFRSLYAHDIDNLFLSSRCLSATHWALGLARVQGTLLGAGQACGTAAALCVRNGLTPHELCRTRIAALQRILVRTDQTIPGVQDSDKANLALRAETDAPGLIDGFATPDWIHGKKPQESGTAAATISVFIVWESFITVPVFARMGPAKDKERTMVKFVNAAGPCHPTKHYRPPARSLATRPSAARQSASSGRRSQSVLS